VPKKAYLVRFFLHPAGKALVISFTLAFLLLAGVLTHYYAK
jgi:VIT1/CCC1 family predicted Fe2+/Mn2+ transporter